MTHIDTQAPITRGVNPHYSWTQSESILAPSLVDEVNDRNWSLATDEMLGWITDASCFEPGEEPSKEVLTTAIDIAYDQRKEGFVVPCSIVPCGNGRIAMEWNYANVTLILEITGLGVGTYTRFENGRIVSVYQMVRNPKSRQMELRQG